MSYNNLTAQQAYDKARIKLDEIDITAEQEELMSRIITACEGGSLATYSKPMDYLKAEKLAVILEEFGYMASANPANMVSNNVQQAYVIVNWKHAPTNSRERLN